MSYTDRTHIEAENMVTGITLMHKAIEAGKARTITDIDTELVNEADKSSLDSHINRTEEVLARYPETAQETDEERSLRQQQIEYERTESFLTNQTLAKSINTLADKNFTNRVMVAACDFTEMAAHHPRSIFLRNFGEIIEEELKADSSKPSKRLASFATTYFWKEGNWARLVTAVQPETTRAELLEFFTLPLNSDPNKKVADLLPPRIIGEIVAATNNPENKTIKFDFRQEVPYIHLDKKEDLIQSVIKLSLQNFTNRILTSTAYFSNLSNPFNNIHSISEYGPALEQELRDNPNKPSAKLATLVLEKPLDNGDIKVLTEGVTPKTTKKELSEFLTTRENWSTNLRVIDYLNHHVVTEMTKHLPEQDRLELWSLKPEMIQEFNVASSLRTFSKEAQKQLINTIQNPFQKKAVTDGIDNPLLGLHVSIGLMGGGNVNPDTLDIYEKFSIIRKRRICSHEDNRRFFRTQEHFRSSF